MWDPDPQPPPYPPRPLRPENQRGNPRKADQIPALPRRGAGLKRAGTALLSVAGSLLGPVSYSRLCTFCLLPATQGLGVLGSSDAVLLIDGVGAFSLEKSLVTGPQTGLLDSPKSTTPPPFEFRLWRTTLPFHNTKTRCTCNAWTSAARVVNRSCHSRPPSPQGRGQ